MIKYTTNDIIKRAEQLADLENSDFISDYEKVALLNEAWQIIYQKIINANDKTWLKWTSVCDGMRLPSDLYQISALYIDRTHEQIPKMNPSQKHGYEIVNGHIYLSNEYKDVSVVMDYFPIPKSLKLKEKTIDAPYTGNVVSVNKNIFAVKDGSDLVLKDTDSDFEYNLGEISFDDIAIFSNAVLIKDGNFFKIFSYNTASIGSIPGDLIPAIYKDTLYFYNKNTKQVVDLGYNIYLPELEIEYDSTCYIIYFDDVNKYQICADYYICNESKVEMAERHLKLIQSVDHTLYAVSALNNLWNLKSDKIVIIETENPAFCVCSDKYVATKRMFGGSLFLEGYGEETLLNYPNNLFYIAISYMLAIQFKIKQSADTTELQRMSDTIFNQLYDSISNDTNDYYQIKNVYSRNSWRF